MNLSKSIDFLLENGRDVIQYRLHKEILQDLTSPEEENLLERVMQTPDYQLLLTHVKPNGYIGIGMHSWDKFKASYLDDGETSARRTLTLRSDLSPIIKKTPPFGSS